MAHVISCGVVGIGRFSSAYIRLITSNLSPLGSESSGHRVRKWTMFSSGSLQSGQLKSYPAACLQTEPLRSGRSTSILALTVAALVRWGRSLQAFQMPLVCSVLVLPDRSSQRRFLTCLPETFVPPGVSNRVFTASLPAILWPWVYKCQVEVDLIFLCYSDELREPTIWFIVCRCQLSRGWLMQRLVRI